MKDVFQLLVDELDLESAVRRGSERNDLLPPRPEDDVLGEVGKRFSETLRTRLERGRYDPTPAQVLLVPKPGNTTRPAAMLTLADRVVLDAIVSLLRPRIETELLGNGIVMWPRGELTPKQWPAFEAAPLSGAAKVVAIADVTGFYETIDHERLRDILMLATGRRNAVNALIDFLGRVMGGPKGVPQGLAASDPIATVYLSAVDAAMARASIEYSRHGDDIRIAAASVSQARGALYLFEMELRRIGLLVNGAKAIIMARETYETVLANSAKASDEAREALIQSRVAEVKADRHKLERAFEETKTTHLGWNLFYHGTISLSEAIEELAPHLEPNDMDVAIRVLRDALTRRPGTSDALSREEFHIRVTSSLVRLAAGKSPLAIELLGDLLRQFPEKTEVVASYLAAQGEAASTAVVATLIDALREDRFRTDWEVVWLLHVLCKFAPSLLPEQTETVRRIALDEQQGMYCRVEALKVLAKLGELNHALVLRLWNTAAPFFRTDLVRAAHHARGHEKWCEAFLAGVVEDAVNKVVLRHLDHERS